ncbi:hypothetical protein [Mangrovibacterium diazotrophicum]|uniref:Outer membrane protein with beta-barrel domain n=1 Tax=Mangrovibacterium diazotrophicum TaxID=1261403 RepID=A0A419VVJ8_9BACT|nr:hypothetical protein [Mangrovibacterium diazotrophicum]RKD86189.1 hypothetical protein BC643_4506 [Mangrovibacterium diazotrophicum]
MKVLYFLAGMLIVSFNVFGQSGAQEQVVAQDTVIVQEQPQTVEQQPKFDASKLYYGGYVNLSFGRVTTVGVAPLIGYKISPKLSVGTQLTYEYVNDKRYSEDYSSSNYGFSIFNRYRIMRSLYTHIEYELMNYELFYTNGDSQREWVNFLFVGGGYSQPISQNVWLNAQILFDVLQDENSPYDDWEPFFSIGVGVGF